MASEQAQAMDRIKYVRLVGGKYPYFRTAETGDVRVRGAYQSGEFWRHYGELLEQVERARAGEVDEQSFSWLVDRYLKSVEFRALADVTQIDYCRTCELLKEELGAEPFAFISRKMVRAVRDDYADQPRKAHKIKQMVSCIYAWAIEGELVPEGSNPAADMKRLKRKGGVKEYVPWSDQELDWAIAAAEPHELTPLLIYLYTGQRTADVCAMTWLQFQGDLIRCRTAKTHQFIDMPCHPVLKAHLEQLRSSAKVVSLKGPICLSAKGKPFTSGALSGVIRRLVERVPQMPNNRSPHGIRYAAAARMAAGGAMVDAIETVLGHQTFKMAMKYASARLRAEQGIAAMKGEN